MSLFDIKAYKVYIQSNLKVGRKEPQRVSLYQIIALVMDLILSVRK
jgi:hypothetical protein